MMLSLLKGKFLSKGGFFHNISILFVCNVAVNVIGLFINMYLARVLRPEGYGAYGVVLSWSNILLVLSSLGIQQVAIRSIAQHQDKSQVYFKVSIIARFLGLIATCILFSIYYEFFISKPFSVLLIILIYTFVLTTWDGIQNLAFGMQRMEYTGYINLIGQLILLILYITIPQNRLNVFVVLILMIIVSAVKDVAYYIKCKQQVLFRKTDEPAGKLSQNVVNIIRESVPFYILSIFTLFTTQFPILFLEHNTGNVEVAYFNTANKLMVPMSMMLNTIMIALFPNLSKDAVNNPQLFIEKIRKIISTIIPIAVFICLFIAMFRNEIVLLLFGRSYSSTGVIMSTQCWYIVLNFLFSLFGTVWAATKHDKLLATLSIIYACVNTPILWFSSKYGASVMSCGFIIGGIINMCYHYGFFLKTLNYGLRKSFSLKLFSIIGLGILISFIFPVNISLAYRIVVMILFSIAFVLFFKFKIIRLLV